MFDCILLVLRVLSKLQTTSSFKHWFLWFVFLIIRLVLYLVVHGSIEEASFLVSFVEIFLCCLCNHWLCNLQRYVIFVHHACTVIKYNPLSTLYRSLFIWFFLGFVFLQMHYSSLVIICIVHLLWRCILSHFIKVMTNNCSNINKFITV